MHPPHLIAEHVLYHSNSLCKTMARASGGANNWRPLSWGMHKREKKPIPLKFLHFYFTISFFVTFKVHFFTAIANKSFKLFFYHKYIFVWIKKTKSNVNVLRYLYISVETVNSKKYYSFVKMYSHSCQEKRDH